MHFETKILSGRNEHKYQGNKRKYPSVKTQMRVFNSSERKKNLNELESKQNCYEQKKMLIEDPGKKNNYIYLYIYI